MYASVRECVFLLKSMNGKGLFMLVSYIKRCLFADVKLGLVVGMKKQMSDGEEVVIMNC